MPTGYIAIDLGAESGRAIIGTLDNNKLTLDEVHRFQHEPVPLPTGLHWDVTGLWREIVQGLRNAATWAKQHDVTLHSVGVDTWGVDWGLVGPSGELVGLPHAYRDPRNQAAYDEALNRLGADRIYQTTGIQFMALNTLYSLFAQVRHGPELVEAADKLLFMPDLLHFWLSGQAINEATIASTSQMIDCQSGDWARDLLSPLGIPLDILGAISPPGTMVGPLLAELAEQTGLPHQLTVVAPGSHDTASAVAAVPATGGDDWCYLSSGTWSLLGVELKEPCATSAAQKIGFTNELGVGERFRFLKNIAGLWLVQECRRDLIRQDQVFDYAELTAQAGRAEPFRTLVDPSYGDFGIPGGMLEKIRRFSRVTGQPEPESPGQFIRCCLESLACAYRQTLSQMEETLGRTFATIHVVGGGGKNRLLNQMTADVTGRSVCVGPYEATATGNTLTQALAAGHVADVHELRQIVANSFDVEVFQPASTDAWQAPFERFLGLNCSR